jgi:hypothetical protein
MTWFKVDDTLHSHKKSMRAGVEAMGLWVLAGSWAADQLTDGWVPSYAAQRIASNAEDLAARLVKAGLWTPGEHDGEDGWWYHEWGERQPMKDEVMDQRRKRAEAGRLGGQRSGAARRSKAEATCSTLDEASAEASAEANGQANGQAKTNPVPSRPEGIKDLSNHGSDQRSIGAKFDEFWSAYPRREAKKGARAKFAAAVKGGTTADDLIAAAVRYAAYVVAVGREREKIKLPTSWLNQGCWDDELEATGLPPKLAGDPADWLRGLWHTAEVGPIEKVTRIRYERPDLPVGIDDKAAVEMFFRDHRRDWITSHQAEILSQLTKDAAA